MEPGEVKAFPPAALHRRVTTRTRPGETRAAVEDDFHHFRVALCHDGERVTSIHADALRHPWTMCALAGSELQRLVGMQLTEQLADILSHTDQSLHCTHLLDLAALAVAASASGQSRRYEAVVPDRDGGQTTAYVSRDGAEVLRWRIEGNIIRAPAPFEGLSLGLGFSRWIGANLDAETGEAAFILRRAVFISGGRGVNLDAMPHAPARGVCFAQQPHRANSATREIGSTKDFSTSHELLLSSDQDWLAFRA